MIRKTRVIGCVKKQRSSRNRSSQFVTHFNCSTATYIHEIMISYIDAAIARDMINVSLRTDLVSQHNLRNALNKAGKKIISLTEKAERERIL